MGDGKGCRGEGGKRGVEGVGYKGFKIALRSAWIEGRVTQRTRLGFGAEFQCSTWLDEVAINQWHYIQVPGGRGNDSLQMNENHSATAHLGTPDARCRVARGADSEQQSILIKHE